MFRFILRRIWQMVPTVFGVILITFVLFNVAGGDIAKSTLGKHVSPKMLEEFDAQRGFNKPLIFGWWTGTRAYTDTAFDRNAGVWSGSEGVTFALPAAGERGRLLLAPDGDRPVPVAFALRPETAYRWRATLRVPDGARATLLRSVAPDGEDGTGQEDLLWQSEGKAGWHTVSARFTTGSHPERESFAWRAEGAPLEIASMNLRRRVAKPYDSQLLYYFRQISPYWFERDNGRLHWTHIGVDFGTSINTKQRVSQMIRDGILPSLSLTVPIFVVGLVTSISISLLCAYFRDRFLDRFFVVLSVALMSINYIVWIVLGQYLLGFKMGLFPTWGYESWTYLLLPVLIGVVSGVGGSIRFYRTIMLDEMYKDYVRTAFAKGVGQGGVLFKHVLRNAMVPVVTNVVITIPFLYTGSLLLESFFGIPGLGYLSINALNSSDVDVIRALVLVAAVLFVVFNLLTDICYAWVDPRVKLK